MQHDTWAAALAATPSPSPCPFTRTIAAFRRWRLERQTSACLNALSDAQLKDIGLHRTQIASATQTAVAVSFGGIDVVWGAGALDGAPPVAVRLRVA